MDDSYFLIMLLALHILVTISVVSSAPKGRLNTAPIFLWMFLLPGVGLLTGWLLLHPGQEKPPEGEWLRQQRDMNQNMVAWSSQNAEVVPLEEALLMNDPRKRRVMIMNMLRADPKKYRDVLLVARFNDDPETAHYATATLMEMQRQLQMDIQRYQQRLKGELNSEPAWDDYLNTLNEFCQSGFTEGQALRRQRLVLAKALREALSRWEKPEWFSMGVRNDLALGQGQEAWGKARRMLTNWPHEECSWLEMMRVCVQTHDQAGMRALLMEARETPVDWTGAGRERLQYWAGKI
ncbi:MAG: hypothetical protein PHY64_05595 [Eubacteriales bacterium]|nr:hypothetical protein [Eubacteriales bacterium]